ncbi:deoxyribonuclease TATDN1 isoform X2 [Condylostylus longicornis]|nr:deoxyribonuclease TATDN1 isoform X2 [Condylostylus longicornis]XP_055380065.1 deoxyribonuclease TATDN1 isoform X2 [Condylostylus longicornis]
MFQGFYNGSQKHPSDLIHVLERAGTYGVEKAIITVGRISEIEEAINISNKNDKLYITIGCHPTRCNEFESNPEEYFLQLCSAIEKNHSKVVAIGECGLDYDRLKFCEKEIQKKYFERQLDLAKKYSLPLFLHCRNAHFDFCEIVGRNMEKIFPTGGVVHSFDGTLEEAKKIIGLGFYIGINGCSLKTEENLKVVKELPNNKILLETDCPWCGIRPSHASSKYVKTQFPFVKKKDKWTKDTLVDGRSEPCQIRQVLEVIAGVKEETIDVLANTYYQNTIDLFFKNK